MIDPVDNGFQLRYGALTIPFSIETGPRKRLSITVFPDLRLRVLAPQDVQTQAVLARIDRRAKWIAKQWRFFQEAPPSTPARLYISGETHLYLGRQYRLKVRDIEDKDQAEGVKLSGQFFWINTRDRSDTARTQKMLDTWYEAHAKIVFSKRLDNCLLNTHSLDLQIAPALVVRRMAKRWGSCTHSGKILLNLELIKAPVVCIDYVLLHELCHLIVPSHGKEFYQLLTKCLPDWEARKKRLEQYGVR